MQAYLLGCFRCANLLHHTTTHGYSIYRFHQIRFLSKIVIFSQSSGYSTNNNPKQKKHNSETKFIESALRKLDDIKRVYTWKGTVLFALIGIIAVTGCYFYFFRDEMRDIMVEEVSTVAQRSLQDEHLRNQTAQMSKAIIDHLSHDSATMEMSRHFIQNILTSSNTKEAVDVLISGVIHDPKLLEEVSTKLKMILLGILNADETRHIVQIQVEKLLQQPAIKLSVQNLIREITRSKEVQETLSNFFRNVMASEVITKQGSELGRQISTKIICDKDFQEKAGEAIWSTLKYTIVPGYFKDSKEE